MVEFRSHIKWIDFNRYNDFIGIKLSITFSWETWNYPYTMQEFIEYIEESMNNNNYNGEISKDDGWVSFDVSIELVTGVISTKLVPIINELEEIYKFCLTTMLKNNSNDIFIKVFDFPKEYEHICSQYLIWFGQFLQNFGIDANISTENDGKQTSVIVSSDDTLLSKSELEALFHQYISLPYTQQLTMNQELISIENNIKFQVLSNQVENFKLQIKMQNSLIEAQELSIENYKNNNNNELLLIKSMKNSDEIEIFDGAICIGEFKFGGIKINPKKIIEKVKKKV